MEPQTDQRVNTLKSQLDWTAGILVIFVFTIKNSYDSILVGRGQRSQSKTKFVSKWRLKVRQHCIARGWT